MEVDETQWAAWKFNLDTRLIQDVWPQLSPLAREIILAQSTGVGGCCDCGGVFLADEVRYSGGLQVQFDAHGSRLNKIESTVSGFETAVRAHNQVMSSCSAN